MYFEVSMTALAEIETEDWPVLSYEWTLISLMPSLYRRRGYRRSLPMVHRRTVLPRVDHIMIRSNSSPLYEISFYPT
jgi:hypothetical protein